MEPITIAHVVRSGFHDMTLFKILRISATMTAIFCNEPF